MLENKVIIITGATSGIGLSTAKTLLGRGAKVMLHCSPQNKDLALELVQELGKNSAYFCLDLTEVERLDDIVKEAIKRFGKVDGLVNNAAVFPRNDITNIDPKKYDDIFNVNIKSVLFLTQAFVKQLMQRQSAGSIVNIGSINAYCGQGDLLLYSITKGAMMTMTRNLADSLASNGIRVNQINVGWTHTAKENLVQLQEGKDENWYKNINKAFAPRGSILDPKEVAKHVAFWLSDDSVPVSGSVYEVEQYPIIGRNKINE